MRKYILLSISILVILLISCKKETKVALSGTITLSSKQIVDGSAYATYGLSFLAGAIHKYPEEQVDLLVIALKPVGIVTATFFSAPDYTTGTFNNTAYNPDLTTAETLFNNYTEVTAKDFQALTDTIKEGQIITFKSAASEYAKILVRSINILGGDDQYAEVKISWVFQPNGTTKF
jgi:hypothetical protein